MDWEPGPRDPKTPGVIPTPGPRLPCSQIHLATASYWTVAKVSHGPVCLVASSSAFCHSHGPQEKHALAFKPSAHRLLCPSQSHCPAFVQLSQLPGLPSFPPTAPSPPPALREGKSMAEKEPGGSGLSPDVSGGLAGAQVPQGGGFPRLPLAERSPPLFRVWPAEAQIPRRCSVLDPASRSWR